MKNELNCHGFANRGLRKSETCRHNDVGTAYAEQVQVGTLLPFVAKMESTPNGDNEQEKNR
jgi:hypothetical protein